MGDEEAIGRFLGLVASATSRGAVTIASFKSMMQALTGPGGAESCSQGREPLERVRKEILGSPSGAISVVLHDVAPLGLRRFNAVAFQGLAPLATRLRSYGAMKKRVISNLDSICIML